MPPLIHCVRHAQGLHNLTSANHTLRDPQLTRHGESQCRTLQKDFPHHESIDLIVASPLQRTLDTALLSFSSTIRRKNLKVLALPELQETSDLPCDTGNDPETLAKACAGKPVDLSLVMPGWESKRGRWAPAAKAITERAAVARQWLMQRPEKEIVVVTHGGFLHYLTEDWTDHTKFEGTGWANTEFRSFRFNEQKPEQAHLVETAESRQRRAHDDDKPLDENEKANFERTVPKAARSHRHKKTSSQEIQLIHEKVRNPLKGLLSRATSAASAAKRQQKM